MHTAFFYKYKMHWKLKKNIIHSILQVTIYYVVFTMELKLVWTTNSDYPIKNTCFNIPSPPREETPNGTAKT